eukprot:scaffold16490_cov73-Phaeocystis_antarctica.AAC.7
MPREPLSSAIESFHGRPCDIGSKDAAGNVDDAAQDQRGCPRPGAHSLSAHRVGHSVEEGTAKEAEGNQERDRVSGEEESREEGVERADSSAGSAKVPVTGCVARLAVAASRSGSSLRRAERARTPSIDIPRRRHADRACANVAVHSRRCPGQPTMVVVPWLVAKAPSAANCLTRLRLGLRILESSHELHVAHQSAQEVDLLLDGSLLSQHRLGGRRRSWLSARGRRTLGCGEEGQPRCGQVQGRGRGGAGEVQGRGGHLLQLSPLSPQQRHLAARVPTLRGHRIQARCCARNHSPVRIGPGLDRAGQVGQAAVGLRLLLGTQEHANEVVRRVRQCGHARRGPPEEIRALGVCHGPRALPVGVCTSRTSRVAPRSNSLLLRKGEV